MLCRYCCKSITIVHVLLEGVNIVVVVGGFQQYISAAKIILQKWQELSLYLVSLTHQIMQLLLVAKSEWCNVERRDFVQIAIVVSV